LAATSPSVVLDGLRKILGSSEHHWVLQADFHRRYQQLGESINDFQQALRLLGRRAFPTLDANALNTRVLEQLVAGVRDPQTRKALLRDRPPTLEKALALARKVSNVRPLSKSELVGYSYETQCVNSLWDKLFIENGVLFYRDSKQYPKRVVLLLSMVDDAVKRIHVELGHSGMHKTK
uniref:Spindle pole body component n=1 Tax=Schistocephalus solidus TaxID=70667 RepID=A0A183SAM3_SCHSO